MATRAGLACWLFRYEITEFADLKIRFLTRNRHVKDTFLPFIIWIPAAGSQPVDRVAKPARRVQAHPEAATGARGACDAVVAELTVAKAFITEMKEAQYEFEVRIPRN